jgi:hypothetical protein
MHSATPLKGDNYLLVGTGRFELPTPRTPSELCSEVTRIAESTG